MKSIQQLMKVMQQIDYNLSVLEWLQPVITSGQTRSEQFKLLQRFMENGKQVGKSN